MIVNNSVGKDNWTQLKNVNEPLATCNVTACINAAQAAGWDVMALRRSLSPRPADDLFMFIRLDQDCNRLWKSYDPDGKIPINQWMAPLALGLAKWLGKHDSASFRMAKWEEMRDCIIAGGSCVVSGHYKTTDKDIDHITALVGIDYDPATMVVNSWIMDDSYGDYRTGYEVKYGDNITMAHADLLYLLKEQKINSKRCVLVPKKV
jgi:hypothetical protein